MSEPKEPSTHEPEPSPMPRWKMVAIGAAVLFLLVGLALRAQAPDPASTQSGMSGVQSTGGAVNLVGGGQGAAPGQTPGQAVEDESISSYSPFFVKGGFSFLIAFCVGWALRTFFKVSALVVGVLALALFGLQKVGWVNVDWTAMSDWWDQIAGKVMAQTEGIKGFLTGNLPSAGLGALGLLTGFKRS
ncbi:MAG: hypothetical protein H6830_05925 [Planctomycetes bacterium]|nr:hypothetical protein [Planctomycetota bacterium]MCB9909061.1 hypothetical protein [Planctomycetota bacterium]MCB9911692.1 hypothetical protein [Planctomycetota bacterium]HPF13213.1 FUN14 domain-containing protein [Planctomycetota bacterium]